MSALSLADQLTTLRMAGAIVVSATVVWLFLSWLARLEPDRRELVFSYLEFCGYVLIALTAGAFWLFGGPWRS